MMLMIMMTLQQSMFTRSASILVSVLTAKVLHLVLVLPLLVLTTSQTL